jgi:hypothetical protein
VAIGMDAYGYKRSTALAKQRRIEIIEGLRQLGIPIADAEAQRASADTEGDAVDALVLLAAARISQELGLDNWRAHRTRLRNEGRLGEGWFPAG